MINKGWDSKTKSDTEKELETAIKIKKNWNNNETQT